MKKTVLQKGIYVICDPSYIFKKQFWGDFCHKMTSFEFDEKQTVLGKPFFCGGTYSGDGVYRDNFDRQYAVDTGMIGIFPIALLRHKETVNQQWIKTHPHMKDLMHIVDFAEDFTCECSERGIFTFGPVIIDTVNDPEDEENEDGDYHEEAWPDEDDDEEEPQDDEEK